jgi:hypothetical protein
MWITELGGMIFVSLYVVRRLGDWLINNVVNKIRYKSSLLKLSVWGAGQPSVQLDSINA